MTSKVDDADADADDDEAASENKAVDAAGRLLFAFNDNVNPWLTCTSDTSNITSFEIIIIVCCSILVFKLIDGYEDEDMPGCWILFNLDD